MTETRPVILDIQNLQTYFFTDVGVLKAVDGVNLQLKQGTTLGIVGESGCGKSVTSQSILRIVPRPGRIVGGKILYRQRTPKEISSKSDVPMDDSGMVDLATVSPTGELIRHIRGGAISMIFQEPMTALSPVHTIGNQIIETIMLHRAVDKAAARNLAIEILGKVGMPQPDTIIDSYRHQLSGGMRQRAMIAIALACSPAVLIADEPTTALDVTVEAQILALLRELQNALDMSIIFISHNLGAIAQIADEVAVMYLGKVVEQADVVSIFYHPKHPYTQLLLQSMPKLGRKTTEPLAAIEGSVPNLMNIPAGCPFHPRCPHRKPGVCDTIEPEVVDTGNNHIVRCVLYNEQTE